MTVGERIRLYRKKNGLSQEELGERLLVSRQTVSLWEIGQTLPTIDNLIRLREVLGVSVDELLGTAEGEQADGTPPQEAPGEALSPLPDERYTVCFSHEDTARILRAERRQMLCGQLLLLGGVLLAFLISLFSEPRDSGTSGLFCGIGATLLVLFLSGWRRLRGAQRTAKERIPQCTYVYELFSDGLLLRIECDGSVRRTERISYENLGRLETCGGFLTFSLPSGERCFLDPGVLKPDSRLLALPRERTRFSPPSLAVRIVSLLLFYATLLSFFAGMAVAALLSPDGELYIENLWGLLLLLPVTVGSTVFGYCIRARGFGGRKNIIAGFILSSMLLTFGCFSFLFGSTYDYSGAHLLRAEELTAIDFPEYVRSATMDWSDATQSTREFTYLSSTVTFMAEATEAFEASLRTDERWLSEIPGHLYVILPDRFPTTGESLRYLVYNVEEGSFGVLPEQPGVYRFLAFVYDTENDLLQIEEYEIGYLQ